MKTVIVGFSKPRKFKVGAWLIMKSDGSNISHGYIRFRSDRWKTSFIYQSTGHGTHFMGGELFEQINIPVEEFMITVPDEVEAQIGNLCVVREGRKYGVLQVIGKGLVAAVRMLTCGKVQMKNPLGSKDQTDCIDEVATILNKGMGVEVSLDMDAVSVSVFRDWIASLPFSERIAS